MAKTKEEILDKHLFNRFDDTDKKSFLSAMDEYAKQYAISIIENISKQEVQVYSSKEKGQDKKYFLGNNYVNNLIERIKKS